MTAVNTSAAFEFFGFPQAPLNLPHKFRSKLQMPRLKSKCSKRKLASVVPNDTHRQYIRYDWNVFQEGRTRSGEIEDVRESHTPLLRCPQLLLGIPVLRHGEIRCNAGRGGELSTGDIHLMRFASLVELCNAHA